MRSSAQRVFSPYQVHAELVLLQDFFEDFLEDCA